MASVSLNKNQHGSTWYSLPSEIRLIIFRTLINNGSTLAFLATVSREWQTEIERHNFARIKLTPSRINDFGLIVPRKQALVGYIWFCLELDNYHCIKCAPDRKKFMEITPGEGYCLSDTNHCPISTSFQDLLSTLSKWEIKDHLILDISIYSLSDSEHRFKYLTFLPDSPDDGGMEQKIQGESYHNPQHGWIDGFQGSAPSWRDIHKIFLTVMALGPFRNTQSENQWWGQLPSVPAITSLILRQQSRRRWKPISLAHMFARLPRLQEIHYEPWREWDSSKFSTERGAYSYSLADDAACSHLYI